MEDIPTLVHADNTCRMQTVTREQNKNYYDLIKAFGDKTGVPILFNTSFNLGGEAIVETVYDAIDTCNRSMINHLYIPEDQGRGCFRGLPLPLFVKSVLFRKKGRGKSLMLPRPCPSRILLFTTIAKK